MRDYDARRGGLGACRRSPLWRHPWWRIRLCLLSWTLRGPRRPLLPRSSVLRHQDHLRPLRPILCARPRCSQPWRTHLRPLRPPRVRPSRERSRLLTHLRPRRAWSVRSEFFRTIWSFTPERHGKLVRQLVLHHLRQRTSSAKSQNQWKSWCLYRPSRREELKLQDLSAYLAVAAELLNCLLNQIELQHLWYAENLA